MATGLFVLLFAVHGWMVAGGWRNGNLPGNEFRQSQTAITALFIQRDANFSLAYPTPVLGAPWSIPMEFPLYQWTVVAVSNATGLPLVQAGRAVSLGCFYGALAALFPLLGALGLAWPRRLVVMGLALTCPLYIFYARGFLIEMMALMAALWFLAAFGRMITAPSWGRYLLVAVVGVLAGLVKVTTFMVFLIPAALWTLHVLRREPTGGAVVRRGLWAVAAIMPAVATAGWWTKFADAVKHRNPNAGFLESGNLLEFNFGTMANRFSADTLSSHWFHISHNLVGPLSLAVGAVLMVAAGRAWWRQIGLCLGCYLATLAIFPTLYAWHDYYAVANAMLLLAAIGVAVAATLDWRARWLGWVVVIGLYAIQLGTYGRTYFELQRIESPGGSMMTKAIELMTEPDEALVVTGYDWDSSVAFYSRRRALMIRSGMEWNRPYLADAFKFQAEAKSRIAVLVIRNARDQDVEILKAASRLLDIDPRPVFTWQGVDVFARRDAWKRMVGVVGRAEGLIGVELGPDAKAAVWPLKEHETVLTDLLVRERTAFANCTPQPTKFYSQFGTYPTVEDGRPGLFAHPLTQLWFDVPAGRHTVRAACLVQSAAYAGPAADRTDGVEFILEAGQPDGTRTRLGSLLLRPGQEAADAGWHDLIWTGDVPAGTSLILSTGPGPAGNLTRDWAVFGPVEIR